MSSFHPRLEDGSGRSIAGAGRLDPYETMFSKATKISLCTPVIYLLLIVTLESL